MIKSFVRVEAISRRVLERRLRMEMDFHQSNISTFSKRASASTLPPSSAISRRATMLWERMPWSGEATPEEIAQMQRLVRQGMEAGAVGFSTNQNPRHIREDKKPVASRLASKEELGSLLDVLGEMNAGVVQLSGGGADSRGRISYAADLARRTGRPVLWQSISHSWSRPNHWQEMLVNTERVFKEEGLSIYAMTQAKPFQMSLHFIDAHASMNSPPGRRLCLTRWRHAKRCSPIVTCEKNCERK